MKTNKIKVKVKSSFRFLTELGSNKKKYPKLSNHQGPSSPFNIEAQIHENFL